MIRCDQIDRAIISLVIENQTINDITITLTFVNGDTGNFFICGKEIFSLDRSSLLIFNSNDENDDSSMESGVQLVSSTPHSFLS